MRIFDWAAVSIVPIFKSVFFYTRSGFKPPPEPLERRPSLLPAFELSTGQGRSQYQRAAALMVVSGITALTLLFGCNAEEPSPTPDVKAATARSGTVTAKAATATATREWAAQNRATAEAEDAARMVAITPTPTPYAKPVDADTLRGMAAHASERGSSRAGVASELKAEGARYLEHAEHCTVFSRNDSQITVWAQRWEHRVRLFCNEHPEWSLDPLCTDMGQKVQSCFGRGY